MSERLTDSTGEGGGGGVVTLELPGWLKPLKSFSAAIRKYGSWPRAVAAVITLYIVNSVTAVFKLLAGSVLQVFDWFVAALNGLEGLLVGAFAWIGFDVLAAIRGLQQGLAEATAWAGPAAPIVAGAAAAVLLFVVVRLGLFLATLVNLDSVITLVTGR